MGRYSAKLRAKILKRRLGIRDISPQRIIDIGAGSGAIARSLSNDGHEVNAIDVVDHGIFEDYPVSVYSGKKIPFDDNTFDYSVLVFVLHHTEDYMAVLKEAARVSRRGLVILEDTPKNKLELWLWRRIDYFLNHRRHKDIDEAHHEFTKNQIVAELEGLGLELKRVKDFRTSWPVFYAYRHTSFMVEKI